MRCIKLAGYLYERGVRKGDSVAIMLPKVSQTNICPSCAVNPALQDGFYSKCCSRRYPNFSLPGWLCGGWVLFTCLSSRRLPSMPSTTVVATGENMFVKEVRRWMHSLTSEWLKLLALEWFSLCLDKTDPLHAAK